MSAQLDQYITLPEAARRAGYRSGSTLRTAAIKGELKTVMLSGNARLTTQVWLDEYMQGRRSGAYRRGRKRKSQDAVEVSEGDE